MIGFKIRQEETNITTTVSTSSMVFDLIYKIMNDERVAIEVSSWSEVASVGDSYETDNFTVKVIWLM
ncbi:hypothetical protein SRRS_16200 [Sporomusa rhizae]|uniref:hypothetical protein n=1 Tax=Sporomusa rhizae TaxID=357999 RepID=UPI00352AC4C4